MAHLTALDILPFLSSKYGPICLCHIIAHDVALFNHPVLLPQIRVVLHRDNAALVSLGYRIKTGVHSQYNSDIVFMSCTQRIITIYLKCVRMVSSLLNCAQSVAGDA